MVIENNMLCIIGDTNYPPLKGLKTDTLIQSQSLIDGHTWKIIRLSMIGSQLSALEFLRFAKDLHIYWCLKWLEKSIENYLISSEGLQEIQVKPEERRT